MMLKRIGKTIMPSSRISYRGSGISGMSTVKIERVGELIQRVGVGNFLEEIGLEPRPEMVEHPRPNPFIKFEEYFVEVDEEEEEESEEE